MSAIATNATSQAALQRYYKLHAGIYDSTRWSFLFGRGKVLDLAAAVTTPARILEIGCGTGRNIEALCRRFPEAKITGVDLSSQMLDQAWSKLKSSIGRVRLIQAAYDRPIHEPDNKFDMVLCSYSLSMFNPGWEQAIQAASDDLATCGHMVLVDFHDSSVPAFRRWMGVNHVRMEGQLQPMLRSQFVPVVDRLRKAYGGLWRYHLFVGQKQ